MTQLCLDRFIDPETGDLREYFDGSWVPLIGNPELSTEPGHRFEWASLLLRWAAMSRNTRFVAPAKRLVDLAEGEGVSDTPLLQRNDKANSNQAVSLFERTARIKAHAALQAWASTSLERERRIDRLVRAIEAFEPHLQTEIPGLYRDKVTVDRQFVDEPAPALGLFHIVCAIEETYRVDVI